MLQALHNLSRYADSLWRLGPRRLLRRVRNRVLVERICDRRLARRGLRES